MLNTNSGRESVRGPSRRPTTGGGFFGCWSGSSGGLSGSDKSTVLLRSLEGDIVEWSCRPEGAKPSTEVMAHKATKANRIIASKSTNEFLIIFRL